MLKPGVVPILLVSAMGLGTAAAQGQDYPNKPVRLVTGSAGGSADFSARLIAAGIMGPLGQPIIVNNQSREEPADVTARAQPDGYTVLLGGSLTWIAPLIRDVPWDPVRDLLPVTLATRQPLIMVVHPSVAVSSVKELLALARAKPGALNYSQGSIGGASHLATELFKSMAGVNIVGIPYKGTGAAVNALVAGEVQLTIIDPAASLPHIKSGKMKALAVTSAQPSALAPGLPTVGASGVPGYETANTAAMFVPAKTPAAIIKRLNQEVVRVLSRPDIKEKYFSTGVETVGSTPEELAAIMKAEMISLGKVVAEAGLRAK